MLYHFNSIVNIKSDKPVLLNKNLLYGECDFLDVW